MLALVTRSQPGLLLVLLLALNESYCVRPPHHQPANHVMMTHFSRTHNVVDFIARRRIIFFSFDCVTLLPSTSNPVHGYIQSPSFSLRRFICNVLAQYWNVGKRGEPWGTHVWRLERYLSHQRWCVADVSHVRLLHHQIR